MPTVLITGTSSGIGRVTTEVLAARGWQVFATMRDVTKKGELEAAVDRSKLAGRVEILQLDVSDEGSIYAAVAEVMTRTRNKIDAVVHNAGVAVAGALEDMPQSEIRRVMETNFFGVLELTRALLPTFRAQRSGRIVIVSSQAGFAGQPANSIYCASKWALEGWAESVAYEVDPFGIDVILVEPGPYKTQIWSSTPRFAPEGSAYLPWLKKVFLGADLARGEHGSRPYRGCDHYR